MTEHAGASLEGRQHGYSLDSRKERSLLVLGMVPSHFRRPDGCVAFSSSTGDDSCKWRTHVWILNRNRLGVPLCNALFIHQRQVCVNRTYSG